MYRYAALAGLLLAGCAAQPELTADQLYEQWSAACDAQPAERWQMCMQTHIAAHEAELQERDARRARGLALMGMGNAMMQQARPMPATNCMATPMGLGTTSFRCY